MSATADIIIAKSQNALLVPSSALYFDLNKAMQKLQPKAGKSASLGTMFGPPPRPRAQFSAKENQNASKSGTLWILKNGIPEAVRVEVGISDGQYTEIISGIDERAQVITALKNGK